MLELRRCVCLSVSEEIVKKKRGQREEKREERERRRENKGVRKRNQKTCQRSPSWTGSCPMVFLAGNRSTFPVIMLALVLPCHKVSSVRAHEVYFEECPPGLSSKKVLDHTPRHRLVAFLLGPGRLQAPPGLSPVPSSCLTCT